MSKLNLVLRRLAIAALFCVLAGVVLASIGFAAGGARLYYLTYNTEDGVYVTDAPTLNRITIGINQ
ncbi:MAG: hypothetical protein LBD25_05940 [Coriobacteriales bacterium]|jgi:hypothetical protein|nr:hypothetical protein [Coriobacteriales bacterium]